MTMDKIEKELEELFVDFYIHAQDSDACEQLVTDTLKLFTPKLQWKSEEITNDGGDNLLYTLHSLLNVDIKVKIYEPVNYFTCHVSWNGDMLFQGTLEKCKQFCSNKILEDFLKLCE